MSRCFSISTPRGPRTIGPGHPAFIIAELSGNHNQSIERAFALIDAAAAAGADAIKLQTYTADTLTLNCDREEFQVPGDGPWGKQTLYSLYSKAFTPWEWHAELARRTREKGLVFFSTPFDETAVDFLESLDVAIYKVASFESGHLPLLRKIAAQKKPVIISRGLASLAEMSESIRTLQEAGCQNIALLHCVSAYPARIEEMNLATIADCARRFPCQVGLSDHSTGILAPQIAVSLGATVIEKHFTLRRAEGGVDSHFSLEPEEFAQMVKAVRDVEAALGKPTYSPQGLESENVRFRRSIFVTKDIAEGEVLTPENIRIIRPGMGLHPRSWDQVLGQKASCSLSRGTPLAEGHVGHSDSRTESK